MISMLLGLPQCRWLPVRVFKLFPLTLIRESWKKIQFDLMTSHMFENFVRHIILKLQEHLYIYITRMYHVTSSSENYCAIKKNFPENLGIEWASFVDKNPHAYGNVRERHLWTKNPQQIFLLSFNFFWRKTCLGSELASFVDKKSRQLSENDKPVRKILWFIEHRQQKSLFGMEYWNSREVI